MRNFVFNHDIVGEYFNKTLKQIEHDLQVSIKSSSNICTTSKLKLTSLNVSLDSLTANISAIVTANISAIVEDASVTSCNDYFEAYVKLDGLTFSKFIFMRGDVYNDQGLVPGKTCFLQIDLLSCTKIKNDLSEYINFGDCLENTEVPLLGF